MKYVYPAIFEEENGKYYVTVPDLSGCHTTGDDLQDAIEMARDAVEMWLCIAEDQKEAIPKPTANLQTEKGFVSWIDADTTLYRKMTDNKAVKKTLSIPSWLNAQAELSGVNFSQVLQEALVQKLHIQ